MIENFNIRKEILDGTTHETLVFGLKLDGKEYQGHYKDEEVSWLQMQPEQENHEIPLEELDAEVKKRLVNWKKE